METACQLYACKTRRGESVGKRPIA